ncbi:MAG: hypothetical protein ACYCQM_11270 [Acidithiobacillus sp.]
MLAHIPLASQEVLAAGTVALAMLGEVVQEQAAMLPQKGVVVAVVSVAVAVAVALETT